MKIMSILFLASVALNVCFLAGCQSLHDAVYGNPCKYGAKPPVGDGGKSKLEPIASMMGIKTLGKSASELSLEICSKLDRCTFDVPQVFEETAFKVMEEDLRPSEKAAMRGYQAFISDLRRQGKRVIVIEPEE